MKSIATSLLLFTFFTAFSQSLALYEVDRFQQYQTLLEKAIEDESMMVVMLYQPDGDFEDMVRGGVFRDSTLKAQFSETIPMAVDVESEFGARMVSNVGFTRLPAFAFFTSDELLVKIHEGKATAAQLTEALQMAKNQKKSFERLSGLYLSDQKLSKKQWEDLLDIYSMNFSFNETQRLVYQYLNSIPKSEYLNDPAKEYLLTYSRDLGNRFTSMVINSKKQLDSAEWVNYYQQVFDHNFEKAVLNEDTVLLEKIKEELIPANAEDSLVDKLQLETSKSFAKESGVFSAWKKAAMKYSKTLDKAEKAEFLYDQAFAIADEYNKIDPLEAALSLARKSAQVNSSFKSRMLYSYLAYLLENYELAQTEVSKALALAKDRSEEKKAENLHKMVLKELED